MLGHNEKVVRKGVFKGITYPSVKKYACDKGELTLTSKHLSLSCEGKWEKTFRNWEIRLEAHDRILEIRDNWYGRVRFRLIVDESKEWINAFEKVMFEFTQETYRRVMEREGREKRLEEWKRLFDITPKASKKFMMISEKK